MKITGVIPNHILEKMSPKDRPKGALGMTTNELYALASVRSEKELQEQIASYLRQLGIPFNRHRMDRKSTGTIGWPDFTFPFGGCFYGVEVKIGGEHPTVDQARCLQEIERQGGRAVVVRTFQQFTDLLR